jgi:hypothetical protein
VIEGVPAFNILRCRVQCQHDAWCDPPRWR